MGHVRGLRRCAGQLVALLAFAGCASPGVAPDGDGACTPGAACNSGNPGDCAAGHIACITGKPSCVPDVTEQSCYGGEPETAHRGTCHPGTQSCIGKVGMCMGLQLPVVENCYNNLDDDCDGHVNNGCPTGLSIGATDPLVARGGTGGGVVGSMCPDGSLVTGVQVQLSANNVNPGYVISVQPSCAKPALMRNATSYTIALTPADAPPAMGGSDAARAGYSHVVCAGSSRRSSRTISVREPRPTMRRCAPGSRCAASRHARARPSTFL